MIEQLTQMLAVSISTSVLTGVILGIGFRIFYSRTEGKVLENEFKNITLLLKDIREKLK